MATTILNPARFNDDGGLGGRQYIRAAFFDEGYGVSESFKAYAQGAGIVPATSAFDAIGAGTVGDPLRMSQFSGFVVPSPSGTASIDPHTIDGQAVSYNDDPSSGISRLTLTTSGGLFGEVSLNGYDTNIQMDFIDYGFSSYENIQLETWLSAGGNTSLWSCRVVPLISSPTAGSSATNTWLPMTSNQAWYVQAASNSFSRNQNRYFQFTLQLALTADTSTVLASALMQLAVSAQTQSGEIP